MGGIWLLCCRGNAPAYQTLVGGLLMLLLMVTAAQKEHDDGQAANPLCHTAPKQDVFRDRFDTCKDGSSRSGEPRQGLEKAIREVGHTFAEQEGHCTEEREHEPRNADDINAIARTGLVAFVFACRDNEDEAGQQGDEGREGHTEGIQPVVKIGHGEHRQHQETFDEQELAFNAED